MRPAQAWELLDIQRKSEDPSLPGKSTAAIPAWCEGEVHFTAIESLQSLSAEGRQMRHCAGSYSRQCALGTRVIYRVEGTLPDGMRVRATVEFVRKSGIKVLFGEEWRIAQLKGRGNGEVDERVWKMAGRLAMALARVKASAGI